MSLMLRVHSDGEVVWHVPSGVKEFWKFFMMNRMSLVASTVINVEEEGIFHSKACLVSLVSSCFKADFSCWGDASLLESLAHIPDVNETCLPFLRVEVAL